MAPVQPNASVAATGLGLRYIGKDPVHCYAYSGNIDNSGTSAPTSVMLDFVSGSGYIICKLYWEVDSAGGIVYDLQVKLNDLIIIDSQFDAAPTHGLWATPPKLLIPPFTHFEFLYGSDTSTTAALQLVGRVYGTEE